MPVPPPQYLTPPLALPAQIKEQELVPLFCSLLQYPAHRQLACDCLLVIYTRKGPRDERVFLLSIIDSINDIIASGARRAGRAGATTFISPLALIQSPTTAPPMEGNDNDLSDEYYVFMKRLCQVRGRNRRLAAPCLIPPPSPVLPGSWLWR